MRELEGYNMPAGLYDKDSKFLCGVVLCRITQPAQGVRCGAVMPVSFSLSAASDYFQLRVLDLSGVYWGCIAICLVASLGLYEWCR